MQYLPPFPSGEPPTALLYLLLNGHFQSGICSLTLQYHSQVSSMIRTKFTLFSSHHKSLFRAKNWWSSSAQKPPQVHLIFRALKSLFLRTSKVSFQPQNRAFARTSKVSAKHNLRVSICSCYKSLCARTPYESPIKVNRTPFTDVR